MKTAIMGTGGLGGFYGGKLVAAGNDVIFIARGEMLRALQSDGLRITSPNGDFAVPTVKATDDPTPIGPVDLIVVCVKGYDLDSAMQSMRPLVGSDTMILPLLNGVAHISKLQETFGASHVLGGVSAISARKEGPGQFRHMVDLARYELEFGEWGAPISERVAAMQSMWEQAGVTALAVPNIVERMWWKLGMFGGAGVFAAARGSKAQVWIPETRELLRHVVTEIVAVAHAQSIPLSDSLPDEMVALYDSTAPTYKPSMLLDLERGNRLEVEYTNGFVSNLSKGLGVATPANDFIYAVLKPYANGASGVV